MKRLFILGFVPLLMLAVSTTANASLLEKHLTFDGIPDVLVSGHHAEVARWRAEQARARTRRVRPDLLGRRPSMADGSREG